MAPSAVLLPGHRDFDYRGHWPDARMPHQVSAGHSTFGRTASGPAVGVMAISSTLLAPCTASISQLLTGATAKASWARVGLAATNAALSRRAEEERLGCRVQITGREEWQ